LDTTSVPTAVRLQRPFFILLWPSPFGKRFDEVFSLHKKGTFGQKRGFSMPTNGETHYFPKISQKPENLPWPARIHFTQKIKNY
jgi:hypothetical protein